mmetsp:Transcript_20455/g.26370  ORF Transcript_20455/g.26370 Transcript_20455/m.26370 type:complete len:108 (-) Transcript_20455:82-405(-)
MRRSRFDSMYVLFSSYSGSKKKGTLSTANAMGRGADGDGSARTWFMARCKYFLPMNPLGHNVSEMSSTGITRGDDEEADDSARLLVLDSKVRADESIFDGLRSQILV